ncbi:uncharacterized protein STEHIDRAFT_153385 [Stereum hirsutum FP-91666 SS1]|uniref:uncharacterized protein n=1 Tax=Stereum hirsutum (strain FP-91666) TaxID=721885 RepID=UPI0004409E21|nr:uncharacterized protein STEHIDRAFT_153385 [Stereum hirsutum FP-91666 SS1]EIM89525.1 hypothetical protein STEHIDRAFT_153385 [Stereum hirsutum FP-91666 SS1]
MPSKWDQKSMSTNKALRAEFESATMTSPYNRRPYMTTLKQLPWKTNAVTSLGSLFNWFNNGQPQPGTMLQDPGPSPRKASIILLMLTMTLIAVQDDCSRGYSPVLQYTIPFDLPAGVLQRTSNELLVWTALGLSTTIPTTLRHVVQNLSTITFNQLVRVFMEHQLFDVMVYAIHGRRDGPSSFPDIPWLRALSHEPGLALLYKRFLDDWPKHLDLTFSKQPVRSALSSTQIISHQQTNSNGLLFSLSNEIRLLANCVALEPGASRSSAIINLQLAAFAMSLLSHTSISSPLPRGQQYAEHIKQRYNANNLTLDDDSIPQNCFKDNSMYMPLALALSISPIFLLSDASTSYKSKAALPHIFALGAALGNMDKPRLILDMEDRIWSAVIQILFGSSPEAQLDDLRIFWCTPESIRQRGEDEHTLRAWFSPLSSELGSNNDHVPAGRNSESAVKQPQTAPDDPVPYPAGPAKDTGELKAPSTACFGSDNAPVLPSGPRITGYNSVEILAFSPPSPGSVQPSADTAHEEQSTDATPLSKMHQPVKFDKGDADAEEQTVHPRSEADQGRDAMQEVAVPLVHFEQPRGQGQADKNCVLSGDVPSNDNAQPPDDTCDDYAQLGVRLDLMYVDEHGAEDAIMQHALPSTTSGPSNSGKHQNNRRRKRLHTGIAESHGNVREVNTLSDLDDRLENALPVWDSGVDDPSRKLHTFVSTKASDFALYSDIVAAQFNGDMATCRPEFAGESPKPLHLHTSASSETYRYGDISQSSIYRVHHEQFRSMIKNEPKIIQAIFAERHILVYGCKTDYEWSWCSRSLQRLGLLKRPIKVQDMEFRELNDQDDEFATEDKWTLADILATAPSTDAADPPATLLHKRLDAFNIPRGRSELEHILGWRTLAHDIDTMEFYDAKWSDGHDYKPTSHLSRATVCSAGVISRIGIHSEGLASAIYVLDGEKYVVVAEPLPQFASALALDRVSAFSQFKDHALDRRFRWEGAMLTKGTILFMRPCTLHCGITLSPTITYERNFYSSTTLDRSVFGAIHSLVGNLCIVKNTSGAALHCLISFMDQFLDQSSDSGSEYMSCPKDDEFYIMLGAVAVFAYSLRADTYQDQRGNFYSLPAARDAEGRLSRGERRCIQIARMAFIRYILMNVAAKRSSFAGANNEGSVVLEDGGVEGLQRPVYNSRLAPQWVPECYRVVFCALAHFACAVVTAHIRIGRSTSSKQIPSEYLIECLADDFHDFLGERAYDHIRMQLHHITRVMCQTDGDDGKHDLDDLDEDQDLDLRCFALAGIQHTPSSEDLDTWDPPPFEEQYDKAAEDDIGKLSLFLDEREGHQMDSRCAFDSLRRGVWSSVKESHISLPKS